MSVEPAQWRRIRTLFEQAMDRAPADRDGWLRRACGDDEAVLREARILLSAHDEAGDFLEAPVRIGSKPTAELPTAELPTLAGKLLGPWRVVEAIGRGGMGEVWRADRADGIYEQQVAIKLLKRGLDTDAILERFLRERRILARLDHPNIARLIDAGATDDGRPYLVMEYVVGRSLSDWCDSRQLDLQARIALIEQVCEAVHVAHRKQIVHRDIKPSNILVNDKGEIKLLDFGIAKLLDTAAEVTLTALVSAPATPEYAAPEQLLNQPVTPATDVYALGVLLYRVLTGNLPHHYPSLAMAIMAATDEHASVEWPSAALRKQSNNDKQAAALQGDLDCIALKALNHQPQRRYRNAGELADDLRRYLDRRPVLAHPESRLYRLGRFVRRHRVAVSAATVTALALLVGLAISLWQAQRAQREALHAQSEAMRADAVKDFLLDIFAHNSLQNPDHDKARKTTAEDLLAIGANRIGVQFKDAPDLRAEMLGTMAQLYEELFRLDKVIALDEQQIQALRQAHGPGLDDHAIAQVQVHLGRALSDANRTDDAAKVLKQAMETLDRLGDRSSPAVAQAHYSLGEIAYLSRPAEDPTAMQQYSEGLRIIETYHPQDPLRPELIMALGRAAEYAGDFDTAEARYRQGLAIFLSLGRNEHLAEIADAYKELGGVLDQRQQFDEAEKNLRAAVAAFMQVAGSDNPETAHAQADLALTLARSGRRAESEQLLRAALETLEHALGDNDTSFVPQTRRDLGRIEFQRGEPESAAALLLACIDNPGEQGDADLLRDAARVRYAAVLLTEGRNGEAGQALNQSMPTIKSRFGERSPPYAETRVELGEWELASGAVADAESEFRQVLAGWPAGNGKLPTSYSLASADLMQLQIGQGRAVEAVTIGTTMLAQIQSSPQASRLIDEESQTRLWLGEALRRERKPEEALPMLQKAEQQRETLDDPQSPMLARTRVALADCLLDLRRPADARPLLDAAAAALHRHPQLATRFTAPLAAAQVRLQHA